MGEWTQERLTALCQEWQGVLRLQDWDAKVYLKRARYFDADNVAGECSWGLPKKTAVIRILDPVDYDPNIAWAQDPEKTLVHELLHLHFAPFTHEDGLEDVMREQAVELIACAMVSLKRKGVANEEG